MSVLAAADWLRADLGMLREPASVRGLKPPVRLLPVAFFHYGCHCLSDLARDRYSLLQWFTFACILIATHLQYGRRVMTQTEFVLQARTGHRRRGRAHDHCAPRHPRRDRGQHEHLTADDIIARAQRRDRAVNPSTVYRTLAFLKTHGLIKSRYFDQDNHREVFEPTPNTEHYHFTCGRCGAVIEFDSPHIASLRSAVAERVWRRGDAGVFVFDGAV